MPQPFLDLHVVIASEDYEALGFCPVMAKGQGVTLLVMADTVCQPSLAGIRAFRRLGIDIHDLILVRMRMHAADEKPLNVLGAAILRFCGRSANGQKRHTRQIVYVTDNTDKVFLSREGCVALGLISDTFLKIGEGGAVHLENGTSQGEAHERERRESDRCDCPRRQRPHPRPERLPFPASADNHKRLEQWLIDHYRSSTFNTCQHQLLPMMYGPPLRLMVDNNATPSACHKAIPVPTYWRKEVIADLDRDVRLGVIEPVPVGEHGVTA